MLCIGSCHDLPVTRSILAAQSISAWDPIGTLKGSLCGSLRFVLVDAARSGRLKRPVWMLGLGMPVVLTVEETRQILSLMSGTPQLIAKVLYGSGLRLMECLRL